MVFPFLLILSVAMVHIFSAVIWIGGNFFELMTLVPALQSNSIAVQNEIATTVPLKEHRNSAIAATLTVISGPIFAYIYSNGDLAVFVDTSWGETVLAAGLVAIVLYGVGWYAGSLRLKIANLTKAAILKVRSGALASNDAESVSLNNRLKTMIYIENALGAIVLALMILAGTL